MQRIIYLISFNKIMNLYQKIVPTIIILGILSACAPYPSKIQEKREYRENRINLFDEQCNKRYNEGPFFEDIPCDEDIFPRKDNNDWVEEIY